MAGGWLELSDGVGWVKTHAGKKGVLVRQGKQLGFGGVAPLFPIQGYLTHKREPPPLGPP